jgi:putative ABC transport system ATP-binding protein
VREQERSLPREDDDAAARRDDAGMSTSTQTTTTTAAAAARAIEATKVYGSGETAVVALDKVTLDLPTGRFTAIMGPSGSGKSTLLHCLAGLDSLTEGRVLVGDVELGALSDKELTLLRRTRIGFVFQAFNLVPTLTAGENIALPPASPAASPTRSGLAR